nr:TetR/AcrR family transcriptional regulator [uncultured Amphritea sp.]
MAQQDTDVLAGSESKNNVHSIRARHLPASDREAQIIERAIECFAQQGFSVSTRELAKHIGVTQPLIYRYFGSKEALAERVHQEVFFSRWNPQWEVGLLDTSRSIEERLIEYLEDYTDAILKNDWVRLFIFAALNDPQFNKRYISLLKDKIFHPVLSELRAEHGLDPEPTEMDIELIWGFHSSFFYMGIRRWIYRMDVPKDIHGVITMRVRHFLYGYQALLGAADGKSKD